MASGEEPPPAVARALPRATQPAIPPPPPHTRPQPGQLSGSHTRTAQLLGHVFCLDRPRLTRASHPS